MLWQITKLNFAILVPLFDWPCAAGNGGGEFARALNVRSRQQVFSNDHLSRSVRGSELGHRSRALFETGDVLAKEIDELRHLFRCSRELDHSYACFQTRLK